MRIMSTCPYCRAETKKDGKLIRLYKCGTWVDKSDERVVYLRGVKCS